MCKKNDFPRYDDILHYHSVAIGHPANHAPRIEPNMLDYTEMYCQPSSSIGADNTTHSIR